MDIGNARFTSIEQITGQYLNQKSTNNVNTKPETSFEEILQQKVDGALKFSKHAAQRLTDRNIELSDEQMERLKKGVELCEEKGIKDSLVLMDQYAFIVNTQKNTVITAIEQGREENKIFTNIDGAVLV